MKRTTFQKESNACFGRTAIRAARVQSELGLATDLLPRYRKRKRVRIMTNPDEECPPVLESEISATIVSLQERFETVRRGALQRARGRLGNLSPDQENAVDSLSRGIIERVLQAPITMLQDAVGADEGELVLRTVRSIFNLHS